MTRNTSSPYADDATTKRERGEKRRRRAEPNYTARLDNSSLNDSYSDKPLSDELLATEYMARPNATDDLERPSRALSTKTLTRVLNLGN